MKKSKLFEIDYTFTDGEYKMFLFACGVMAVLMIDVIAKACGLGGII